MAVRCSRRRKPRRVLVPKALHPAYRRTLHTIVGQQDIEVIAVPFDRAGGHTTLEQLAAFESRECTALVINQPNFFGVLEKVDALTDWAHRRNSLAIGVVTPMALALLSPPGEWGEQGADIACGEAQPLGMPLASGGPYAGFLCCRQALVRQLPRRIAGRTLDQEGRPGFTLTLQASEQHIRRSKAISNICTNQGLLVTAAAIHMALLGTKGLERVAAPGDGGEVEQGQEEGGPRGDEEEKHQCQKDIQAGEEQGHQAPVITAADGMEQTVGEAQGEPVESGVGQRQQDQKDRDQQQPRVIHLR